jgi:hypothetical protein
MTAARRVCLLGNSHTFYNAYAYQLRALAEAALGADAMHIEAHAAGGCGLDWHRNQPASVQTVQLNAWDDVVLQHASHPWPGEASLAEHAAWWADATRASAGRCWLTMSWPELIRPQDAPMRADAYRRVAAAAGLRPLPIADAWMAVRGRHPDLVLYDADREHASPLGSYLAACTALAALCEVDPRGLPGRIVVRGRTLVDADAATAALIQAAAWTATRAR